MRSQTISTKLQKIAKQAVDYPQDVLTILAHYMNVDFLQEAYRRTHKSSSPGIIDLLSKSSPVVASTAETWPFYLDDC